MPNQNGRSLIRRSSREIASWDWFVPFDAAPSMQDLVRTLVQAHDALDDLNLFRVREALLYWAPRASGDAPADQVHMGDDYAPARTFDRIMGGIERGSCAQDVQYFSFLGRGMARDSDGRSIAVDGLFELNGFWNPNSIDIELTAHHDVWFPHAFDGSPQPRIYRHNAPRLTEAIHAIGTALDTEVEPGDVTFFCEPGPEGILLPDDDEIIDGMYFDVTPMRGPWWTFHETPAPD